MKREKNNPRKSNRRQRNNDKIRSVTMKGTPARKGELMSKIDLNTALDIAVRLKNHYRAFEHLEQMLLVASNIEGETARLRKEQTDLTQKLADLHTRVDEKQIELQETIDSMTSTAEAESNKAKEALGKLKRHCDEQMTLVREKYVRDKEKMAREIGDLEGQRAQLVKAIKKLDPRAKR
jgi:hypothetical protein